MKQFGLDKSHKLCAKVAVDRLFADRQAARGALSFPNSEVYQFLQKYQLWPDYKGPYYYVVIQGIFELCTLYGENISSWSDFKTAVSNLRSFCEEEDCKAAIRSTKLSVMLYIREKFVLCLLKLHMYKTITALIYIRNRCSRNTRSV